MEYFFYIIYSESIDKYYFGHTSDLAHRLAKHNTNHQGFTGKANDWRLVYSESFDTKSKAYKRERKVKSWKSRKLVQQLIENNSGHPD